MRGVEARSLGNALLAGRGPHFDGDVTKYHCFRGAILHNIKNAQFDCEEGMLALFACTSGSARKIVNRYIDEIYIFPQEMWETTWQDLDENFGDETQIASTLLYEVEQFQTVEESNLSKGLEELHQLCLKICNSMRYVPGMDFFKSQIGVEWVARKLPLRIRLEFFQKFREKKVDSGEVMTFQELTQFIKRELRILSVVILSECSEGVVPTEDEPLVIEGESTYIRRSFQPQTDQLYTFQEEPDYSTQDCFESPSLNLEQMKTSQIDEIKGNDGDLEEKQQNIDTQSHSECDSESHSECDSESHSECDSESHADSDSDNSTECDNRESHIHSEEKYGTSKQASQKSLLSTTADAIPSVWQSTTMETLENHHGAPQDVELLDPGGMGDHSTDVFEIQFVKDNPSYEDNPVLVSALHLDPECLDDRLARHNSSIVLFSQLSQQDLDDQTGDDLSTIPFPPTPAIGGDNMKWSDGGIARKAYSLIRTARRDFRSLNKSQFGTPADVIDDDDPPISVPVEPDKQPPTTYHKICTVIERNYLEYNSPNRNMRWRFETSTRHPTRPPSRRMKIVSQAWDRGGNVTASI